MKAAWYETQGAAGEVLQYGDRDTPRPQRGEVLVCLHASAVNPSDVKKRVGAQPAGFEDGYVIPHSDGAGVIEAVGDGVSAWRIGERVWVYQAQFQRARGTAAEYVALPADRVAALPERAGFDVGACMGIPAMTAHRCVFNAGDPSGRDFLITGASGRVGYYAVQWAKMAGARVIATAGGPARCAEAMRAGADRVLDYRTADVVGEVMEVTGGQGVHHVVEVEFGVNAQINAAVIRNQGVISTYSSSLAPRPEIPFYPLMFKNVSVNMVLVYNMPEAAKQHAIKDIHAALKSGSLDHRIAERWPLAETARAHESVEQGGRDGCVIIETRR